MNIRTLALLVCVGASAPACKFLVEQLVDYVETWSSGLPKSRGTLFDGQQSGEWVYFYESGKPRAKGRFANDRQVGPWTYYYENQVVERSGAYDDKGLRAGEWLLQHPDQTPQARGSFVADFEDGPWQFFAADGSLERQGQYDAGQLSGQWEYFQQGGKPRAAGVHHLGQRIGVWRLADEQGKERESDFGVKPGVQIVREWWPGGALRRVGVSQGGAAVGRWTTWHDNGRLRFCCTLAGSVPAGVFEARDAEGNIVAQGRFVDGAVASGGIATAAGQARPLAAGPLPASPAAAPWSPFAELAAAPPEAQLAALLAELRAPLDPVAAAKPKPSAAPTEDPATAQAAAQKAVAQLEQTPTRAEPPTPLPPTQFKLKDMESFVMAYDQGVQPGSGNLLDKYRVTPSSTKPAGTGELTEWYGKQMPFSVMRGVDGKDVDLAQFRGRKKVMIVVLRGFLGEVCPYCVAQTKALSQCRKKLDELEVEVFVIYPGSRESQKAFEQAYRAYFGEGAPPYRVCYDPDLALVQQLGIAGDLASPSTLVLDRDGSIRFFYKGEHRADRPTARRLTQLIEGMQK